MINTVALMGRLTYEPELKQTPSGISVIRFQIACDRNYQKQGEDRQADFIDCIAWRQTAEFINRYFSKGSMIAVEGAIQTSNYTDKDGNKRKQTEVVANNVSFCGSKAETSAQGGNGSRPTNQPDIEPDDDFEEFVEDGGDFEEIVTDDDDDLPL